MAVRATDDACRTAGRKRRLAHEKAPECLQSKGFKAQTSKVAPRRSLHKVEKNRKVNRNEPENRLKTIV
jgi:hypothetical protein